MNGVVTRTSISEELGRTQCLNMRMKAHAWHDTHTQTVRKTANVFLVVVTDQTKVGTGWPRFGLARSRVTFPESLGSRALNGSFFRGAFHETCGGRVQLVRPVGPVQLRVAGHLLPALERDVSAFLERGAECTSLFLGEHAGAQRVRGEYSRLRGARSRQATHAGTLGHLVRNGLIEDEATPEGNLDSLHALLEDRLLMIAHVRLEPSFVSRPQR